MVIALCTMAGDRFVKNSEIFSLDARARQRTELGGVRTGLNVAMLAGSIVGIPISRLKEVSAIEIRPAAMPLACGRRDRSSKTRARQPARQTARRIPYTNGCMRMGG